MELPALQVDVEKDEKTAKIEMVTKDGKHEVSIKLCSVKNVTVFKDRAEVNRVVEVDLNVGEEEVLVTNLPSVVDPDSLRVKCFGDAKIVEVAYQEKTISEKSLTEEQKSEMETEGDKIKKIIKDLENEKKKLNEKIRVAEKEKELLENFAKCVSSQKEDKVADIMDSKSVENFLSFLTIYQEKNEKLSEQLFNLNGQLEMLDKEIQVQRNILVKLAPNTDLLKTSRNVSVLLEVSKSGKVTLIVSYVVSNASWTPLYDIRAFNKDSSVQILYFATIRQNTGEDWEEAKLSLSTAMPSVGGSPPDLTPQTVNVIKPYKAVKKRGFGFRNSSRGARRRPPPAPSGGMNLMASGFDGSDNEEDSYCAFESAMPTAKATEGITSTSFEIARPATIQSDGVGHKVSICQLDFSPEFEYIATPKLVEHAFLKIKTKNDSTYAMLAGDANVFLDNNFLTKSELPAVSPMEEFEIALGVDPAVKVIYKPVKKFQQTSGLISKSELFNYHQQIEIKNTKTTKVKITITDQCPRSVNEKVKVHFQEPDIKLPKSRPNEPTLVTHGNATFNVMDYKIDWLCEIEASKSKTIDLRYQIEHPVGDTLKWM